MRICFVSTEIFHWGYYGGFGKLTRMIGANLVKAGFEVYVLMPIVSKDQRTIENLDGMTVIGLPSRFSRSLFKLCQADIFHSEEPDINSYLAMIHNGQKKHIITFQDPRTIDEQVDSIWRFHPKWNNYPFRFRAKTRLNLSEFLIRKAINRADGLFCQAKYIIPRVQSMYNLKRTPVFLPNPVEIPERSLRKDDTPTVCFIARWDPVKRNEVLLGLVERFPDIRFIVPGKAHSPQRDCYLRELGRKYPNLEMPGFVSEGKKSEILERSWVMVNTSSRECLPVSFLEASAHKCAILSSNNPDEFAEKFGYFVTDMNFEKGLNSLIKNNNWKEAGERGYEYVKETHELSKVLRQHIEVYKSISE